MNRNELVLYRIERAKNTLEDARILAENERWNSSVNRLYYAAYYAILALLMNDEHKAFTHNGVKTSFSKHYIKTGIIPIEYGKIFSQLFTWRQK